MAITRADTLTSTAKKSEIYSDFFDSFTKSPFSNELALVKNEKSVSQSIKNLILTDFGERFFNPNFGSNASRTLFEQNFEEDLQILEQRIRFSIENYEPRALLNNVTIRSMVKSDFYSVDNSTISTEDLTSVYVMPGDNENSVEINIVFTTINNTTPVNLTVLLKRVR